MCPTRGDERVSTIDGGSQADEPLIPSRRRRGGVHARATSHHIRQRRERAGLLTGVPWVKNFGTLRPEKKRFYLKPRVDRSIRIGSHISKSVQKKT